MDELWREVLQTRLLKKDALSKLEFCERKKIE